MAQFLRPDSNIANTWTGSYTAIDEATFSDTDFVYSANNPNGSGAEFGLSNPAETPGSGTVTIRYRYAQVNNGTLSGTGTATSLVVTLLEGATVRGTSATHSPSGSFVAGSFTVDASTITNWNDLRVRFAASGGSGSPANRRGVAVSWAEVEAPDAPSGSPGNASQSNLIAAALSVLAASASGGSSIPGNASQDTLLTIASSLFAATASGGGGGGSGEVTFTELAAHVDTTNQQSYDVTLSRALGANKRAIVGVLVSGSAPTDTATISGGGVTWTKRATDTRFGRSFIFTTDGAASPSGTTLTVDTGYASATAIMVWVAELDGDDGDPSGWQYATNSAGGGSNTELTTTLASAPAADSTGFAFAWVNQTSSWTWTTDFVEAADFSNSGPVRTAGVATKTGSAPQSVTATTSTAGNIETAYVEVKAAAGGGGGPGTANASLIALAISLFSAHADNGTGIVATDTFTRSVSNGLGTNDTGGVYDLSGSSTAFDVDGSKAIITTEDASTYVGGLYPGQAESGGWGSDPDGGVEILDTEVSIRVYVSELATTAGDAMDYGVRMRCQRDPDSDSGTSPNPTDDWYGIRFRQHPTDNRWQYRFQKAIDGPVTNLTGLTDLGSTPAAGEWWRFRGQVEGVAPATLRFKLWKDGDAEPSSWIEQTDTQSTLEDAGGVAFFFVAPVGTVAWFDDLTVKNLAAVPPSGEGNASASLISLVASAFAASSTGKAATAAGLQSVAASALAGTATGEAATTAPLQTLSASILSATGRGMSLVTAGLASTNWSQFDPTLTAEARATAALQSSAFSVLAATAGGASAALVEAALQSLAASTFSGGATGAASTEAALQSLGSSLFAAAATGQAGVTAGLLGTASTSFSSQATGQAQTTAALLSVPTSLLGAEATGAAGATVPLLVTVTSQFGAEALGKALAAAGLQTVGVSALSATATVTAQALAALQSVTGEVLSVDPSGAAEAAAALQSIGMTLFSVGAGGSVQHDAALLLVSGAVLAAEAHGGGMSQSDLLTASVAVLSALAAGSALANASQVSAAVSVLPATANGGASSTAQADLLSMALSAFDPAVTAGSQVMAALLSAAWAVNSVSVGGGQSAQVTADLMSMALSQMAHQPTGSALVVPGLIGAGFESLTAQVSGGASLTADLQQAGWSQFAPTVGGAQSAIVTAALLAVGLVLNGATATGAGLGVAGIAGLVAEALDAVAAGAGITEAGFQSVTVTVLEAWAGETIANFVGTATNRLSLTARGSVSLSLDGNGSVRLSLDATESLEVAA